VRRALDSLWRRGLVDKFTITWHGQPGYVGASSWRIHDDARAPEPAETERDPYGGLVTK
jgi:hypothetical protein